MSIIQFTNARGQVRYQPQHPDGRRQYLNGWEHPFDESRLRWGKRVGEMAAPWERPKLYRSKRRASRALSKLIVNEELAASLRFREVS